MKVSLLLLTFFFVAVLGDASGHWALKHCPDYQTCSSYVEECMTYFNQIVSGSSISAECLLYRRCPVGYEYLSDAEINEEKCLRVDSGGLQETLGNYEIPAVLDPYISFEDCMVSGTSVTGYSRSGLYLVFFEKKYCENSI